MPYIASNNGLTVTWRDPSEDYRPQPSEISFEHWPAPADLAAAFPGLAAAAAAAQAASKPRPTPREWLERLSPATQLALETAALTNAQAALWLRKATGNPSIDVTLPETKEGVAAIAQLVPAVTAADQAALLAP